ncbi:ADP-ribosylglycohydrolase family protein [Serpentinicella sp. ANB-PHB4]|uniref:ADP-ribosylglycohydrolase family protein n=1 Tax=Serpentinicella sp. ANB-PHB4 TaxID=3074076 RepID=UPI0028619AED|nr:ADP-ribosylglycohydrolase family protein [Serpentinicella sp. ANB-PHB4]MDR5658673.1 ADP-ribosylglycohydrolase family protein [Serpentinicella sp. ANB-PHB4]
MHSETLEKLYDFLVYENNIPKFMQFNESINLVPKSKIDYLDKIRGAFVGLAIGDAFGNFVDGQYGNEKEYAMNLFKSNRHSMSLTVTDDTEMTILIAESLIINQGFNPEDIANRFIKYPITDSGETLKTFITNYRDRRLEWFRSGVDSAGNGAAMRCAPAALINYGDYTSLKMLAGIQGVITHVDEMATASSIGLSVAIAQLLNTEPFILNDKKQLNDILSMVGKSIKGIETTLYTTKAKEDTNLYNRINFDLYDYLDEDRTVSEVEKIIGSSAYVLESLPLAMYAFLRHPNNFDEILRECLNAEDTDTVTSMALTLVGAYIGFSNIPRVYISKVRNLEEILVLSDRLFELSLKNKLNNPYRRMREQSKTEVEEEKPKDEIDQLIWLGIKHNKQAQYELSVKYFETLLKKYPEFKKNEKIKLNIIEAYEGLGSRYIEKSHFDEALKYFKRALEYDLNHPEILCNLAVTYLNLDDLGKAEKYARRAVEIAPNYKIGKEVLSAVKGLNRNI